jgi:hypothetical protein
MLVETKTAPITVAAVEAHGRLGQLPHQETLLMVVMEQSIEFMVAHIIGAEAAVAPVILVMAAMVVKAEAAVVEGLQMRGDQVKTH